MPGAPGGCRTALGTSTRYGVNGEGAGASRGCSRTVERLHRGLAGARRGDVPHPAPDAGNQDPSSALGWSTGCVAYGTAAEGQDAHTHPTEMHDLANTASDTRGGGCTGGQNCQSFFCRGSLFSLSCSMLHLANIIYFRIISGIHA